MPDQAPGDALLRLSRLPGAALARHGGRWIVAADPVEQVVGDDCWDVLRAPVGHSGLRHAMAGGWIGLLAYDAGTLIERLPAPLPDPGGPAKARLARYDAVCVIDEDGAASIEAVDPRAGARLRDALRGPRPDEAAPPVVSDLATSLDEDAYRSAVDRARALIRAGDCYQVNLAQRLTAPWGGGGAALARALWRAAGETAHRGYLDLPEGVLVSASPELLVRTRASPAGVVAMSSPIKGTAKPGAADLASAKNVAEHVMIVDLIRNDLGRVAVAGGVTVPRMLAPLRMPYADHLVSDVEAVLRPDASVADLLRALIPGGSVTGCPKIRAMEVIRELEPVGRGPAFGSMVCAGADGSVEASVLIRTAWLTPAGEARYWCGGAVVWDSDPREEVREAWLKATPFLRALGREP